MLRLHEKKSKKFQRFRVQRRQRSEGRKWRRHHPKPNTPARVAREGVAAAGTPHTVIGEVERAAAQHTELFRVQLLTNRPLCLIRWIGFPIIYTPRPFPHIPAHLLDMIGIFSLGETANHTRSSNPSLNIIGVVWIGSPSQGYFRPLVPRAALSHSGSLGN